MRKGRCPLNPAPPGALAGALAAHEQLQEMKSVESPPGGAAASKLAIDRKARNQDRLRSPRLARLAL